MTGAGEATVVVSPHLDDAVLSLGAFIARTTRSGGAVRVVTVFAGDPASALPAGGWDSRAGFATEGVAATARRLEDEAACRVLGAEPVWLPFSEAGYRKGIDEDAIATALESAFEWADRVLVPGFPLTNPDHALVMRLVFRRRPAARLGLYAEQPYRYRVRRREPKPRLPAIAPAAAAWSRPAVRGSLLRLKRRAAAEYRSQLPLLGLDGLRPPSLTSMLVHEALHGGEAVAWLPPE